MIDIFDKFETKLWFSHSPLQLNACSDSNEANENASTSSDFGVIWYRENLDDSAEMANNEVPDRLWRMCGMYPHERGRFVYYILRTDTFGILHAWCFAMLSHSRKTKKKEAIVSHNVGSSSVAHSTQQCDEKLLWVLLITGGWWCTSHIYHNLEML